MSNNDTDTKNYWFSAQRYGWGWGLPLTWQGWIIVIAYTVMIIAGIEKGIHVLRSQNMNSFFVLYAT